MDWNICGNLVARVESDHRELCKWGFPGSSVVKNLPANAGDMGLSPGLGRSHMLRRPNAAKKKKFFFNV